MTTIRETVDTARALETSERNAWNRAAELARELFNRACLSCGTGKYLLCRNGDELQIVDDTGAPLHNGWTRVGALNSSRTIDGMKHDIYWMSRS